MEHQESIKIIREMIHISRGNVEKNSFYFLLWGIVVAIANLGHFAMLYFTDYPHPYRVWLLTIPASIITIIYALKQDKEALVSTFLDSSIALMWILYGVIVFTIVGFGASLSWQINPIILLFTALPTAVTGSLIKFKPLLLAGFSFFLFAIISFLITDQTFQFLLAAIAITCGYIIPGILLRKKENQ